MSHDWSDSDDEETPTSQVHLAFIDCPIEPEDDVLIEDTFLGGKPLWMHPDSPPRDELFHCDACGKKMALLLQAEAPLPDKLYDRVIYVFGCKNTASCSRKKGSIKAFRGISKDPERVAQLKKEQEEAQKKALDDKLSAEGKKMNVDFTKMNPFGESKSSGNPFDNPFGNPFEKKTEPEKGQDKKKTEQEQIPSIPSKAAPTPHSLSFPSYPAYFLHVEPEKIKKETKLEPELEKYKHLIDADMDDEEVAEKRGKNKGRRESGASLDPNQQRIANNLDDKYFEAFTNTVKHNPGQVLRYDLGGRPLFYSGRDEVFKTLTSKSAVPKHPLSKTDRRFELQLMPKAIMDLEQISDKTPVADLLNGMAWGTIIVCTDKDDVSGDVDENGVVYEEEWVGVQWEE